MTTQTEMFPKTELDEATAVLAHLINEDEKASTAADNAVQKEREAGERVRKQRHVVAKLQAMMPAAEPIVDGESEEDIEDAEILQIEGDVLDPITGELTGKTANPCPACKGDGRIPDKTGGGYHGTCPTCGGSGTTNYDVVYEPDTLTVKELAEEFGALVVAAGDVDEMNEADAARYNALSDELTARGRNPQDWRRIAEDEAA